VWNNEAFRPGLLKKTIPILSASKEREPSAERCARRAALLTDRNPTQTIVSMAAQDTTDPSGIRTDYHVGELLEASAADDPLALFTRWFRDAELAEVPEVNAMTLATADAAGRPSARIVLLKGFDSRGFTFFTNYQSRKGQELAANPRAALVFFWAELERQVRIDGAVERVTQAESEAYFHSRPFRSQVGAMVSHQSTVIGSRAELDQRESDLLKQFDGKVVPMPDYWGGYRVVPEAMEFWQGRPSRLHDRLKYSLSSAGWKRERLSP
jgi:pyridoxamine 5'-phosphate oxidase